MIDSIKDDLLELSDWKCGEITFEAVVILVLTWLYIWYLKHFFGIRAFTSGRITINNLLLACGWFLFVAAIVIPIRMWLGLPTKFH